MQHVPLETSATFQALQSHYADAQHWELRQLFAEDTTRFSSFSLEAAGLLLDYSKNKINGKTLALLCTLARERGVEAQRDAMFAGEKINRTEQRAVLHTALRAPRGKYLLLDDHDVNQDVHAVLNRIGEFTEQVRSGAWVGHSGKVITDIVNIGIGGSDLGPKMACQGIDEWLAKASSGTAKGSTLVVYDINGNEIVKLDKSKLYASAFDHAFRVQYRWP